MWRNYLIGKLAVAIVASYAIGAICVSYPWRSPEPWTESLDWLGTGAFFVLLGTALLAAVYLLHRKP